MTSFRRSHFLKGSAASVRAFIFERIIVDKETGETIGQDLVVHFL